MRTGALVRPKHEVPGNPERQLMSPNQTIYQPTILKTAMKEQKDILITWLKDAHAMESNVISMLDKQASRMDDFPLMKRRIAEHAEESRRHAEQVEQCLNNLGSDTSTLKEGMAKVSGKIGPMAAAASPDEPVKATLANISTEHFEIACYSSLRAAAEHCGEAEVARVAESIMREEEAMAGFLEEQLAETTRTFMEQRAGAAARH